MLLIFQGLNNQLEGASYTFGCSWSMYLGGCKYGKGGLNPSINKFRMSNSASAKEESEVAEAMHRLADDITPLYAKVAPQSFANMTGMPLMRHLKGLKR